jgi:secondary thiamine-phosphate synthase enzyme
MQKTLIYNTPATIKLINLTQDIQDFVKKSNHEGSLCHIFVKSTTSALLIMEDEAGIKKDLLKALEIIAPQDGKYHHNRAWKDDNGFAHLRAEFLKQSLVIPLSKVQLNLGAWQNIFLIDFDNKKRQREILVTII